MSLRRAAAALALTLAFTLALALGFARLARAHDPFESTTVARIEARARQLSTMTMTITMTRGAALAYVRGDEDPSRGFAVDRFAEHEPELTRAAASLYQIHAGGRALFPRTTRARLSDEGEVELELVYDLPAAETLELQARHLAKLPPGFGNALTVSQQALSGANPQRSKTLAVRLLTREQPSLRLSLPALEGPAPVAPLSVLPSFVWLGVDHLFTGFDHLLFLAGLLLPCRRLRSMVVLVSCFTAAHSITLVLAALGRIQLPAALVEPLIAGSIVLVGLENLLSRDRPRARPLLTFAFGLVHGLGFASSLRDAGLPAGSALLWPVLSFNLGIELAQLALVGVALPLLLWLRRRHEGPASLRLASASLCLAGSAWLLERTLLA